MLRVQARDAEIEAERTVKEAEAALQERDEEPRLADPASERFKHSLNSAQAWQRSAAVCDDRCTQDGEGQRPHSVSCRGMCARLYIHVPGPTIQGV